MKNISVLAAAALVLGSGSAFSQTATDTMGVSMTVTAECTISAGDINFGSVGILDSNLDASTNITVQCTEGSPYEVGLSVGAGASATVASRKMTHATDTSKVADYSLYSDSGRLNIWGNTLDVNTVAVGAATGSDEVIPVYGRVFSGQNVPTGAYADTITATITYGGSL